MERIGTMTDGWWKINQRGITWKIRNGEQLFLCMSHHRDLIHILVKLHEDIPKGYRVMVRTRIFGKKYSKGHSLETKKEEQSFLCATRRPDLIHIPIKFHEDILNG